MLSCQRASWSSREAGSRQSRAEGRERFRGGFRGPVAPWKLSRSSAGSFLKQTRPWPQGPGGRGPGTCQPGGGQGTPGGRVPRGRDGRGGIQICSSRPSPLPVVPERSASHTRDVVLHTRLLGGPWSERISSSLWSVSSLQSPRQHPSERPGPRGGSGWVPAAPAPRNPAMLVSAESPPPRDLRALPGNT